MKIKVKFNVKPFLNYISVILFTALAITVLLIALPLTEKITDKTSFDLLTKDTSYWAGEYTLKLNTNNPEYIQQTRDILFKRLNKFGVERAKIVYTGEDDSQDSYLTVLVTTTANKEIVKELISNRFEVAIMTRKEDVDFFSEENQYAYLLAENYNSTDWDRSDFRNVYITELRTADNNYSNFAIFKLWPNRQGEFNKFLEEYKGEYIGVSMDGFVTPYLVPFDEQNIFAVPISSEDEVQIKAIDILYNSGIIPANYTLESEEDIQPNVLRVDHIRITIGLAISILLTYIYLVLIKQSDYEILRKSFLSTVLSVSIYLTILKLLQIPIDTFLLPILVILTAVLIKILSENDDSIVYIEVGLIAILSLFTLLGIGYMPVLASNLIALIILSKICLILSGWYIDKVKNI